MPSSMFTAISVLASTICVARAAVVTSFPLSVEQSSNFTIDFTGNQIALPISFLLLPVNSSSPLVVELPDTAFDSVSNSGTYTTPIPFSAGTQFIAVVHDALGIGNGGVSTVYTVGGSHDAGCALQQGHNHTLAFRLSPSSPPQCELQRIIWTPLDPDSDGDNLNNVNITGYVLGGLAFKLNAVWNGVSTGNSTLWRTSVPQGQTFMFLYERRDPATGAVRRETSAIQNVQPSSNSDCTRGGPSVTPAAFPPSTSGSATQTLGLQSPENPPENDNGPLNLPIFALIGIIVGGICLIVVIILLLHFLYTRKHDQQTTMSDGPRAAPMKISPNAPTGIPLPPIRPTRASGLGVDSVSADGPTAPLAATSPPQWDLSPSPDAARQRHFFGRMKGRQEVERADSIASWGNKGPLIQSMLEPRPEPKSVPMDAMSDISEYSTPESVLALPPQAAISMSRGGSGPGRQRMQFEVYYPQSYSRGSGARSSSSKSWDYGNPLVARTRPPTQTYDPQYSPTEPSHDSLFMSPMARQTLNYSPSRTNPLVRRQLSAYEVEDDNYEHGAGRARRGAIVFSPALAGQLRASPNFI